MAPASRTLAINSSRSEAHSVAGNGHAFDTQGWRVRAILEDEIVRRPQIREHVDEIARDGHFAHRVCDLPVLDPKARCAAAVVAGDAVDAHTDQLVDIEALGDIGDELVRRQLARHEIEVAGRWRWRSAGAARGMAGRREPELPRRCAVQEPRLEDAVFDQIQTAVRNAFAVERLRSDAAYDVRIVDD